MRKAIEDVTAFHLACDVPVLGRPTPPSGEVLRRRIRLVTGEYAELIDALTQSQPVAIADALADSIYVLVGTALELGLPLGAVWDIVQAHNMMKVNPETGKVLKDHTGKVLKPEGWTAPEYEISKLLLSRGLEIKDWYV